MYEWYLIKDAYANLENGKITEITVADKNIALLKKGDQFYAFAATCPHASARFCDGWLDAQGRVVCPEHKYRFDPANGRNTSGEGYKLKTYPIEIRDNEIFVGLLQQPTL
ncbi:Rieske (2Fe-2S) protein [Taibaiella soli]|uniref:(2Fe-2S)-binding protein n=1 Tax=Taibaiella soli TaxID=1649169 RepID=A0A2W2AD59_9BACT|nr:Rieske (2Fe-2S) protein [Taibaiella soli]PZF73181.1 (2Fe-2S)-binding protein [Taibaiella soli]